MTPADEAIRAFGETMGMDNLQFADGQQVLELNFEDGSVCRFEQASNGALLISVHHEENFVPMAQLENMLRLCDYQRGHEIDIRPGADGNRLSFMTTISERDLNLSRVDQAVSSLNKLHAENRGR